MVTDPEQYIRPFADAGADHLTFHLEPALDPHAGTGMSPLSGGGSGYDPRDVASTIRSAGMTPGIAINPNTPADRLLDGPLGPDLVEAFDLVLVMSVMPGFSGQAFKPEALDTAQAVRSAVGDRVRVQMDGGVNVETAPRALESGVDVLVAASAIFNAPAPERSDVVRKLRGS
jgi:ribulose-phosphate 3-epimerase